MDVPKEDQCHRHCQRFGPSAVVIAAMLKRLSDCGYTGSFTVHFSNGEVKRIDQHSTLSMDEAKKIAEVA